VVYVFSDVNGDIVNSQIYETAHDCQNNKSNGTMGYTK